MSDSEDVDVFIRDEISLSICNKVLSQKYESFESIVSARNPFKLGDPTEDCEETDTGNYKILGYFDRHREFRYLKNGIKLKVGDGIAKSWKLFVSKADGAAGQIGNPIPARIMGNAEIGEPNSVCSETYLVVGPFSNRETTLYVQQYMKTKFFRFMVGLRKTKNIPRETYKFVPLVSFDRHWTDLELYDLFGLDATQINYIESMIQEMN